jgi:hypothetical protein
MTLAVLPVRFFRVALAEQQLLHEEIPDVMAGLVPAIHAVGTRGCPRQARA